TKLVQLEEFTLYDSRPEPARGGIDYVGSGPLHRYYRVSDGWVAVCGPDDRLDVLEQWAGGPGSDIEGAMRARTRSQAVSELTDLGITAVRVVEGDERASDEHLSAHSVLHVVDDPGIGRCRVVNNIASWSRSPTVEITTVPAMGSGQPAWGIGQH
ncbi:MAG: CoA transferase, partial [Acidimicrobiia bacterium]